MNCKRPLFSVFLIFNILSCLLYGGCKKPPLQESTTSAKGTIRIGEVGSMTGSDATFGISTHNGILLAFAEVNAGGGILGHKLELITQDDQGKSSEAVLSISKLINQQNVLAVLGEVASTLSIAMAPIAQQYKVPLISPSSINAKLTTQGDYIFRVCFLDQFQSKVMADFALQHLKAKSVAILQDIKSDYSRDSAKIFSERFIQGGGKIVMEQSYSAGDIDFKSQLTAIRSTYPDVILVPGHYTEVGLIARQQKELGIQAPLLGGDAWDSPKLKEIGGGNLDGSYFVGHFSTEGQSERAKKFVTNYKATFGGISPDGLAALGYDAAHLLADALKRSKSFSRSDLREAIATTRDFEGITGKITIGPDRNAIKPAFVFRLKGGGNQEVVTLIKPD